jgi:predicted DNA-binding transcriptional regulator AlpA
MLHPNNHLKITELAEVLGVSERTLNRWHALRQGPPRCKIGRTVLYRTDSVSSWLAAHEIQPLRSFKEAV